MTRRFPPNWFTFTDDRTLEYLYEEGTSTPSEISDDSAIRRYRAHINERLRMLDDADLVNRVGYGKYVITDLGREYLNGETCLQDLQKPGAEPQAGDTAAAAP